MKQYRSLYQAALFLAVLLAAPLDSSGRPVQGKFGYTLTSVDFYRLPESIRKKSPDGSPLPSTDHRLGLIRAGSQLEILERRPGWLRIRNRENDIDEGWVQDDSRISSSDPRLYFRMNLGNRILIGYGVFNVSNDLSGGHVRNISFTDGDQAGRIKDLSNCTRLTFFGAKVSFTIPAANGQRKSLGGDLKGGDCYLISNLKIRLNQVGRKFVLERIR
jgi:hypothetical protein